VTVFHGWALVGDFGLMTMRSEYMPFELTHLIDALPGLAWTALSDGRAEFLNRRWLDYTGLTTEQAADLGWIEAVHPDDRERVGDYWRSCVISGISADTEARMRRHDGAYRWFRFQASPVRDAAGNITRWFGINFDIEDRKHGEEVLKSNERSLSLILNTIPAHIYVLNTEGAVQYVNQAVMDYTGLSIEDVQQEDYRDRVIHPEDFERVREPRAAGLRRGATFSTEQRVLGNDGQYRWFLVRYKPLLDEQGRIVRWYVAAFDIEDRKRAVAQLQLLAHDLQERERESRLIVETIPGFVASLSPAGEVEFVNKQLVEYCGQGLDDMKRWGTNGTVHVDDQPHVAEVFSQGITSGEPYDFDARIRRFDGVYRWLQVRGLPLRDMNGQIARWYVLLSDVDDRKRAEAELRALKDQLYKENLVLRDEVDRTSMFEEIVGTAPALQPVLARVAKVARTDSTVLVTGETGTGKELVARAIHRRSSRAPRAFVSVNCAAIPRELIASELFGHEKGAFTGATQRRLGRFELAHGGTLFLDEVGDLPMETQIVLLRVLQEREFERVGATTSVRVDVRVVAATNRDLQSAIEAGTFRSDLFYRLNVFPIAVPALRERPDDISLLVEYFIDRYARKAGKTIRRVNKRTLDHLRSYPWPGNVRELQNVIERSVIVCDTDEFIVDESWLSTRPPVDGPVALSGTLAAHEKAIIEEALRASGGRVFGPSGAAARLGIPRSTLESKIRTLRINKNRFRPRPPKS
jgi:PAS domain S-box-containing protein